MERLRLWHDALDRGIWAIGPDGNWTIDATHFPDVQWAHLIWV